MKVRFLAALADSSGYSEASRNYLCALDTIKEIELCATSPKFELWSTDIGRYGELVAKYTSRQFTGNPDLQIIHLTPDCYLKNINPNCKNVGYAAWETSLLPTKWLAPINALDEIWVPSRWNKEVFEQSGVKIPVHVIPHAISVPDLLAKADGAEPQSFNIPADKFAFYSIFQWTERKNPVGLVKAFFSEFRADEPVVLVLKSYIKSHAASERDFIRSEFHRIRSSMYLTDTAPIVYVGSSLGDAQIAQLHKRGDCLVAPTRAEGFGLCNFEAMAFGNPVITTNYSGHLDFCNEQNSYLIDNQITPCSNMPWDIYHGRMSWGEPSLDHLKRLMRHVFENREEAVEKGRRAAETVKRYDWETVGRAMWTRMKAVVGGAG